LISALRSLQEHRPFFTDNISELLFARFLTGQTAKRDDTATERLTPREKEIVRLLAEGNSNNEAAQALGLSSRTVETHRAAVIRKLRVNSLAGLIRYAIRNGIVEA
jgi:DNA-binding NarL/FixJ family response regulator